MNFKYSFSIAWFLLASLLHAQNVFFSGVVINESELADIIINIKQINVGIDSPDVLANMLGKPALKTRQAGIEEWQYNFMLENTQDIENMEKIENALETRMQRRQRMSLEELARESRANDDKYEKLETIKMELQMKPSTQVSCKLKVSKDGKISNIRVEKYTQDTTDILYVKGDLEDKRSNANSCNGQIPLTAEHPQNPNSGQIYFNSSDKHFYGWDGASWLKLDAKP